MESIKDNNINVILICGIPGVGKSTCADKLRTCLLQKDFKIETLNFDKIFLKDSKIDLSIYNQSRLQLFNTFKTIIHKYLNTSEKLFILLDDNFYFRSMRKPYYKFIKDILKSCKACIKVSYLEVHLRAKLEYCINNNNQREGLELIPNEIIEKMHNSFEYHSFLKPLVYLKDITSREDLIGENEVELILNKLENNYKEILKAIENEAKQKKTQNKELKAVFIEQLDIALRAKNGELLKVDKTKGKELSALKQQYLQLIKSILYSKSVIKLPINTDFELLLSIQEVCNLIKESGYGKEGLVELLIQYDKFTNIK
jgi:tRNA uridine 5-carbamoylmethylation protein Kti12